MKHVLKAGQFDKEELLSIMSTAGQMETLLKKGGSKMAEGKILAALFYEPSTRTRLSFETAMLRLGGSVISETDVHFSSITKGEVLEDTIRIVANCADIIAIRSKHIGDADLAASVSGVPVLNAGDGAGAHPTQALLDLYTISKQFGLDKEITVSMVGDLKYGRTVHSLTQALRNFENIKLNFVAPSALAMPAKFKTEADGIYENLTDEILAESDVIYDTRIQSERFENKEEYEKHKNAFIFDVEKVSRMKPNAILMHPLPRVNEITMDVDALPQAKYFEQAANGIPVRMALIARALNLV